jgi:dolichol kinase
MMNIILTLNDIIFGIIFSCWVAFVTLYLSRIFAKTFNTYVARKMLHILGGGIVAIFSPFVFSSPLIPIIASYIIMGYLLITRKYGRVLKWFQEESNIGEIYFSFSFGTILLIMWIIDNNFWYSNEVWITILPLIFMSFGDGITGIIRNYVYKERKKGLWGTFGMAIFCTSVGYLVYGLIGVISAIIATIAELSTKVDDNLTVPFASFLTLLFFNKIF